MIRRIQLLTPIRNGRTAANRHVDEVPSLELRRQGHAQRGALLGGLGREDGGRWHVVRYHDVVPVELLAEERAFREVRDLDVLVFAARKRLQQNEATVVFDALSPQARALDRERREGLDGVDVELVLVSA